MDQEYIEALKLNPDHRFERISSRSENRKGQDTDFYEYREYDTDGNVIGTFTVADSTGIYPPQKRTIRRV